MPLRLTSDSGRVELSIDLPPVNVLDVAALEQLARLVVQAGAGRVLVLKGPAAARM